MKKALLTFFVCAVALAACFAARADIVFDDFEGELFNKWAAEGSAFGDKPQGIQKHPDQRGVGRQQGETFANSFSNQRLQDTGRLVSQEFTIERRYLNALMAGGKKPTLALVLHVEGEPPRKALGPGEQYFRWVEFDLQGLEGKKATIEIVDEDARGWIAVDYILQTDDSYVLPEEKRTRPIVLEGDFLNFPIKQSGITATLSLIGQDGERLDAAKIRLAAPGDTPDYWVFMDVSRWRGQRADLNVSDMDRGKNSLELIVASEKPLHLDNLYEESFRPRYHFTPALGWNNDVNGTFYLNGKWHLYYQSNPYGAMGDFKNWGHAESTDLVNWKQLPQAMYSYVQAVDRCYSGSALVDWKNTSGLGKNGKPPVIACFTDTGAGEVICYSNDEGLSFTYYKDNPVVKHKGRDPRIFWYQDPKNKTKGHWVLVTFTHIEPKRAFAFYTSDDLLNWEHQSDSEPYYECPDIYKLPVDGNPNDTRWVMVEANSQYVIGDFDGKKFTPQTEKLRAFAGAYYATQSFSDAPDGRVVQMAWAMIGIEKAPITHGISLPTEMSLRTTPEGVRLFSEPVKELEQLRGPEKKISRTQLRDRTSVPFDTKTNSFEAEVEIDVGSAKVLLLQVGSFRLDYNVGAEKLFGQPYKLQNGKLKLRIFADVSIIEVFADDGRLCVLRGIKNPAFSDFSLRAEGGTATLTAGRFWPMKSIWDDTAKQSVEKSLRVIQKERDLPAAPLKD